MSKGRRFVILIIFTIVMLEALSAGRALSLSYELDEVRHVVIVAVSMLPNGSYVGVSADLYVRVTCPGNGHVYVETLPLSQIDLQASTRVAALVASSIANTSFNSCDYYASIKAGSPIVGGPSASGVTAVAFAAALLRLPLNESVVMTGMIMPDGSIGPVGGIKYKLEAASSRGAKVFLVPYGQTVDYVYQVIEERWGPAIIRRTVRTPIDLIEYGKSLGIEVIPIATVYEALEIFTNGLYRVSLDFDSINRKIDKVYEVAKPTLIQWIHDLKNTLNNVSRVCSEIKSDVLSTVKQRYGTYTYRQIANSIDQLESSLNTLLAKASNVENAGKLYSAASMYFQALIYAYTEYYLLNALKDQNFIPTKIEELRSKAYNMINDIHRCCVDEVDITKLTIAINVLDRVYEALLYINATSSLSDVLSIASYIAYADARLRTADQWYTLMRISTSTSSTVLAKTEDIKSMATYVEMLVQNIYAYIISLSSESIQLPQDVEEAEKRYTLMQNTLWDLDKLALGISSISYMYQALVKLFTQSLEASVYTLNKTLYIGLGSIASNMPIDVVLYLELAKSLIEESGDYSSGAIALAKLSMMIAIYKAITTTSTARTMSKTITTSTLEAIPTCPSNTLVFTTTTTLSITITKTITSIMTSISTIYGEDIAPYAYATLTMLGVIVVAMLSLIIIIIRRLR